MKRAVRGWLLLPAVAAYALPLVCLAAAVAQLRMMVAGIWLTGSVGLVCALALLAASVRVMMLFHERDARFPKAFIGLLWGLVGVLVVSALVRGPGWDDGKVLIQLGLQIAICRAYFQQSSQVAAVFGVAAVEPVEAIAAEELVMEPAITEQIAVEEVTPVESVAVMPSEIVPDEPQAEVVEVAQLAEVEIKI